MPRLINEILGLREFRGFPNTQCFYDAIAQEEHRRGPHMIAFEMNGERIELGRSPKLQNHPFLRKIQIFALGLGWGDPGASPTEAFRELALAQLYGTDRSTQLRFETLCMQAGPLLAGWDTGEPAYEA